MSDTTDRCTHKIQLHGFISYTHQFDTYSSSFWSLLSISRSTLYDVDTDRLCLDRQMSCLQLFHSIIVNRVKMYMYLVENYNIITSLVVSSAVGHFCYNWSNYSKCFNSKLQIGNVLPVICYNWSNISDLRSLVIIVSVSFHLGVVSKSMVTNVAFDS